MPLIFDLGTSQGEDFKEVDSMQNKDKPTNEQDVEMEENKVAERVKKVTVDPSLLLAFAFFDRNHSGYIVDKDLENLILSLGLTLSRHQVRGQRAQKIDLFRADIA